MILSLVWRRKSDIWKVVVPPLTMITSPSVHIPTARRAIARFASMLIVRLASKDRVASADRNYLSTEIRERLAAESESPALSVSAGVAAYPEDGDTPEKLLGAADRALYRMKNHGASSVQNLSRIAACL